MRETFLSDLVVTEIGDRQAVGGCGTLLAELGATVILAEVQGARAERGTKWEQRAAIAAGKRSIALDPASSADGELLRQLLARSDVVLASSDRQPEFMTAAMRCDERRTIVCDIRAFGDEGPFAGSACSDLLIQALCGLMDTTGAPEDAPTPTQIAVTEMMSGVYAAAGVLAALRVQREHGVAQPVEVTLYGCAVSTLTTFLAGYCAGQQPQRIGNHHPSMSPWNAYRAADGWVLLCSGSDGQWRRVCELIGRPELATAPRYGSPTSRVQVNAEVDAIVEQWTRGLSVAECIERFNNAALACGPVYTIADLWQEPSLEHRGMVQSIRDGGATVRVPGSVFRGNVCRGIAASEVVRPDHDRAFVTALARKPRVEPVRPASGALPRPLAGIRVIEIGNYTTAPLVARQLGALGADVVKIEPPSGDSSRALPPHRDGQGYFFTLSNSEKRSLVLDLRTDGDKATFRALLARADVLVENLKPGSLARLGFGQHEIAQLNPRLVYCPISGFGTDSPYAERAAMDTTIQAMSGIMDLTHAAGVPYKTGISSADLAGGQFGLLAILAALDYRDRTGRGQSIDVSMQDCAVWLTHLAWNGKTAARGAATLVACSDGYVAAEAAAGEAGGILGTAAAADAERIDAPKLTRAEVVELLRRANVACAPVQSVAEVATHPQTRAGNLIVEGRSADGTEWPLLACPIRLGVTPTRVERSIGALGADGEQVLAEWLGAGEPLQRAS